LRELAGGIRSTFKSTRAAFLGPIHSYSHLATLQQFGQSAELVPVRTIAAVFEEVSSGQADAGVVPIENSTDGRIVDTLEMLAHSSVKICGEIPLRIHHNLLGIATREDVTEVCSKPQAISQCREWLANHLPNVKVTAMSSTTTAAERAANDASVAAVASYQAGVEYGLKILAENIEDNKDNITRFAVIGPAPAKRTGKDKTSLMFELPHQPGALADAMIIFKRNRLNLTWIESLPKPGLPNEYLFFVEFVGYQTDMKVRRALASLAKKTVRVEVLGSYAQSALV
jgi:chorismate mutase/prephenate dehydratase